MVRKKLLLKKIDNPSSRQVTYSKRRDGIVKKASELSVLCDTNVGILMFSPTGRLTSFASDGRIEDIFLRYVDRPNELRGGTIENEEYLSRSLKNLKYEGEILEKIEKLKTLEDELHDLNQLLDETQEKMRSYNPDMENITSVPEALVHWQFLTDAIERIEHIKGKLLGKHIEPQKPESIEDPHLVAEDSADSNGRRKPLLDDHRQQKTCLPVGPHLSVDYLKTQSHWNLQCGGTSQG